MLVKSTCTVLMLSQIFNRRLKFTWRNNCYILKYFFDRDIQYIQQNFPEKE